MLPHVLPYVAGCPDATAEMHLVLAARRFCTATMAWNYSTEPVESEAGVELYPLKIDAGQDLVRLLACDVNGSPYEVPSRMAGRSLQRNKNGSNCVLVGNGDFRLVPAPHMNGWEIVTDVAVMPALISPTDWPEELEEFVIDIADGAISTLCALPATTWRDPDTAAMKAARFADRINTVALRATRDFGQARRGAATTWY